MKTQHVLDRIALLQQGQDLTEFCKRAGLSYEAMKKNFQRRTVPDSKSLTLIANRFCADLHWLITGKRIPSTLNSRAAKNLKLIRQKAGWSAEDLAKKLSLPAVSLKCYEKGMWTLPLDLIQKLAKCLNVPPESFLEEDPTRSSQPPELKVFKSASAAGAPKIRDEDYVSIPLTDSAIAAGQPIIQENNIEDYVLLHIRAARKRGNLVASRVDGESMEPTLHSGDIVVIDRDDKKLVNGKMFAVFYEDGLTAKYIERRKDLLILRPLNPSAQVEIIDLNECPDPIVGRIIGAWKEL